MLTVAFDSIWYNLLIARPTRICECDREKISISFHESGEIFLTNLHSSVITEYLYLQVVSFSAKTQEYKLKFSHEYAGYNAILG